MPIALASSEQNSTLWPPNGAFRLRRGSGGRRRQAAAGKTREALSFLSLSAVRPAKGPPDLSQNRPHSAARPSAHTSFLPPHGEAVRGGVRPSAKMAERRNEGEEGDQAFRTRSRPELRQMGVNKKQRGASPAPSIQVRLFAIAS